MFQKNAKIFLAACSIYSCTATDVNQSSESFNTNNLLIAVFGNYEDDHDPFAQGAQTAADEINAAGGINGHLISLIYRSSGCNSGTAAYNSSKLLGRYPNILAVAGPECSGAGLEVNRIFGGNNIPVIGYTTSSPLFSNSEGDPSNTYFRLQASDSTVIAGFVNSISQEADLDSDGVLRLGIIHGADPFTSNLGVGIAEEFISKGGVVDSIVSFDDGVLVDFSAYMDPLFKPDGDMVSYDALAIMAFNTETANITEQFRQYGISEGIDLSDIPIYVNGLWPELLSDGANEIVQNTKSLSPDGAYSQYTSPDLDPFLEKFNSIWGTNVEGLDSARGYDSIMLLGLALLKGQVSGITDDQTPIDELRTSILNNIVEISRGENDFESESSDEIEVIKPFQFSKAEQFFRDGININYNGASGFIDFDEVGDINYGAFTVQVPTWNGSEFQIETLSEICFGPPICSNEN